MRCLRLREMTVLSMTVTEVTEAAAAAAVKRCSPRGLWPPPPPWLETSKVNVMSEKRGKATAVAPPRVPTHMLPPKESASAAGLPCHRPPRNYVVTGVLILSIVIICAVCNYFFGPSGIEGDDIPDPELALPPSGSRQHSFAKAAVCTDGPQCSEIGRGILDRNGSAVDAAVAAVFCNGLVNMVSMGIGGGFFMTVYLKSEERAYSVVARETAPGNATENMFKNPKAATRGGLAVGVPGLVRGLWAAHERWGSLPWRELVEPSVQLCRVGYNMSTVLYDGLLMAPYIMHDPQLRMTFFSEENNEFHPMGWLVRPSEALCRTLQRIAEHGADEMYSGELAADILADLKEAGGIITADDLNNYTPKISEPIEVQLSNGDTLYTPPPPSSGLLLGYILSILSGYNFTAESIADTNSTVLTYHRIVEAFKYAYATRTQLGDADFLNLTELIKNITSTEYAADVRRQINDTRTYDDPAHYGAHYANTNDSGTAHISIIAPNGDAVSITSSINHCFGAGFSGTRTGIVFNNVMDDFSYPIFANYYGFQPSPANVIRAGKRPLSSISPSIIVDNNMNAKMVIGSAGGSKITTSMALVIMRMMWFNQSIKQAVDSPRIHHQMLPMVIEYEYGNTQDIVRGLKELGHNMTRYRDRGSVVCGLFRNRTGICGNADYRNEGEVFGIN